MSDGTILKIKPLGFPWETQNPFLFCVYHADAYPKGNEDFGPQASLTGRNIGQDFTLKDGWRMYHGDKVPGFPSHPHRGFETITVVEKGLVDHADSLGAAGRYGNGDVQWMTAGSGLQHSEMFPLLKQDEENPFELFQIWLNLPKSKKFADPHFAMQWHEQIPVVEIRDEQQRLTSIKMVAGKFNGKAAIAPAPDSWAADPANEIIVGVVKMDANATWKIPAATPGVNRTLYFFEGKSIRISGQDIHLDHLAELAGDREIEVTNSSRDARLLFLQGRPIQENIVHYGPFVMNTNLEIQQAMDDYRRTRFGGWPWPRPDMVHPRGKGRFARFANGKEVQPELNDE
ncbi:MAG: pirin family protein [bacterium]|jgi:quercetin 2,3-dioxygenase